MVSIQWKIKRGDLVKISSSDGPSGYSYGVVISKEPLIDQLALFPAVMVFSFSHGCERQYYPYNLEIVSAII
jgi:hypothetical protein|tara:strand:+ start:165 stop:380 length:216 start_codon:yes stop_codon:yes gene_type:complete